MKGRTEQRRDLFNRCLRWSGPRGDARIEIVWFEGLATTFAIAIDFGGDPHERAGELPIVLTAGVGHPAHLPQR
ncbi:hypothetical protein [Allorhodopirellula solitaria]|uniref:hypothetical protein n=1 Tax=Allorhodopirellula solitaria TaxID=2527987 RepID=UPI0011B73F87|nr:hypothetical protein [Allorhodopirellula solitaria]